MSVSSLEDYRRRARVQQLVFDIARGFTKQYTAMPQCTVPAHALFPQLVEIVRRYIEEKVTVNPPGDLKDVGLSPYYGWLVEILAGSLRPDTSEGEAPEVPRYEANRAPGSTADVDYWTSRDVREVQKSHLNFVVAHTTKWEQSAAYFIDTHPAVGAFVKNEGLGFAIPYFHNGQDHDYMPDFIIRLKDRNGTNLILETKGYDPLEEAKISAAKRWVEAVNAEGSYGHWAFCLAKKPTEVSGLISSAAE